MQLVPVECAHLEERAQREEHQKEHQEGRGPGKGVGAQQRHTRAARLVHALVDQAVPVDGFHQIAGEDDGEGEHQEADDPRRKHAPQPPLMKVAVNTSEEGVQVGNGLPALARVALQQCRVHLHLEQKPLIVLCHRSWCGRRSSRPGGFLGFNGGASDRHTSPVWAAGRMRAKNRKDRNRTYLESRRLRQGSPASPASRRDQNLAGEQCSLPSDVRSAGRRSAALWRRPWLAPWLPARPTAVPSVTRCSRSSVPSPARRSSTACG
eukprot:scaffold3667_cov110-Isochrysis_galbana.AAC.10